LEKRVVVLIVNYNSAEDSIRCLKSLAHSSHQDWMFLLVDNYSTDDSAKVLTDYFQQELPESQVFDGKVSETFAFKKGGHILFLNKENRGFAAGNNVLLEHLRHWNCLVWLLNPDIEVAPIPFS